MIEAFCSLVNNLNLDGVRAAEFRPVERPIKINLVALCAKGIRRQEGFT
jgi:hypothetical protein